MPRSYTVIILPRAQKQLLAIPNPCRERVAKAIDSLRHAPRPRGCKKLVGDVLYRIRIGDYRVIYGIDDGTVTVTVTKAAHRRESYR